MIIEIRRRLALKSNITTIFDSELKIVVDNLNSRIGFNESDYVLAMCYFKRIASAVIPVISQSKSTSKTYLVCHEHMLELNEDAPNVLGPNRVTKWNKVFFAAAKLGLHIRTYCHLVKTERIMSIHQLIDDILYAILNKDDSSNILRSHIKNLVKEFESNEGKITAFFYKQN
ncbi:hypothetical protein RF11_08292 [Thelohanellus kitauei]|uniref:Uncharacterized protein n=1 Tax=Thelohanellus kitauei TaxID=669202 RepID=A0A0C2N207_THEKT|nr:hypothetical protein RF11_08292 [Thelohanellus kitauei]